eukprot:11221189-Lingulodinium_polyedra.AAC.1
MTSREEVIWLGRLRRPEAWFVLQPTACRDSGAHAGQVSPEDGLRTGAVRTNCACAVVGGCIV